MLRSTTLAVSAGLALLIGSGAAQAAGVLFWSDQAAPIDSTKIMREQVLAGFPGVDFQAGDTAPFLARIEAEIKAGSGSIDLIGGLQGELASYTDNLADLSDVDLGGVKVAPVFLDQGKLGTSEQKFLPWMQANYVMAANKKALPYLPEGASLDTLTYDQLVAWMKNIAEKTGSPKFGFPAGPKGLSHRFFQGFLLPAYTGSPVSEYRSADAEKAWNTFKDLWKYTNPASTTYNFMEEPLQKGDVWVAFDHVARLAPAIDAHPDDFVTFPAPSGPKGLAFMPVLAGIAIPKTAPDMADAKKLAAYILQPSQQVAIIKATGFYPVTDAPLPADLPASAKALGDAVSKTTAAKNALPVMLPVGLGTFGGQFNQVFIDSFQRIVLANQDVHQVLQDEGKVLGDIMVKANAPCWAPDKPSNGPCPVN
ncbi:MAG TPA: extracellular solute-binding protein [Devosiaceae bacterium]|jgi:multiple sugar transport system substrate-binding protein